METVCLSSSHSGPVLIIAKVLGRLNLSAITEHLVQTRILIESRCLMKLKLRGILIGFKP